jgi:hypothetical protein
VNNHFDYNGCFPVVRVVADSSTSGRLEDMRAMIRYLADLPPGSPWLQAVARSGTIPIRRPSGARTFFTPPSPSAPSISTRSSPTVRTRRLSCTRSTSRRSSITTSSDRYQLARRRPGRCRSCASTMRAASLLPAGVDPAKVARSEYEIQIQPGIRYQPHPAFATDSAGKPVYLDPERRRAGGTSAALAISRSPVPGS